ncbi:MAG TPA: DNA polymerase III subunit gamma/tau [Candidatus Atribacteria bacterium]|nr:DNA polymerase III subunit gamma/tau [Candidatus Atribacteria bacterium]
MSTYTALYRQWRPDTFDEVVGQDVVIRTLKNQLESGRIAHAYLFCGSRGTGKTSTAKIFARAVNCMDLQENGPCGRCEACVSLSSGNNMDIIEIDAASNNSVDDVRDLRDKIKFPPAVGKYRVYIVDEVHMLSTGAFNALLKTLEEPPAHAVFILATTAPHKLPSTILSRCQRFDFKRIPLRTIVERLKAICTRIGAEVEEAGLYTIARWAEGGMRDALSLLDQCIGFCGSKITNDDVLAILGTADQGFIFRAADDMLSGNAAGLIESIDRLSNDGKDLTVFIKELTNHFRNLLVAGVCDEPSELLDVEDSELERLISQAKAAGESRLVKALDILTGLEADIKYSSQPRVLIELAMVKICRPSSEDGSLDALLDRIEALEQRLKGAGSLKVQEPSEPRAAYRVEKDSVRADKVMETEYKAAGKTGDKPAGEPAEEKAEEPAAAEPAVQKGGTPDLDTAWTRFVKAVKKERLGLYSMFAEAVPRLDGNVLTLCFTENQGFHAAAVEREDNRKYLEQVMKQITGSDIILKCQVGSMEQVRQSPAKDDRDVTDDDYIVRKAYEVFGEDLVEVIEE